MATYKINVKSTQRYTYEEGKLRRKKAKTMLLAICYGMGAGTAGERMGYEKGEEARREGEKLMNNFFAKFPNVQDIIEQSKKNLLKYGYVEDWAGRRRHLPDIFLPDYEAKYKDEEKIEKQNFNPIVGCVDKSGARDQRVLDNVVAMAMNARSNKQYDVIAREVLTGVDEKGNPVNLKYGVPANKQWEPIILTANTGRKAQAERQCLNARIQGGAASLTKLAMVNIFNDEALNRYGARLVATVHDEVLVEAPALFADEVTERLPQVMIDTAKPYITVPMKCDPYTVDRWYADTGATELLHEFSVLQKKKGLTKEEALEVVIKDHPELTVGCIKHTLETGDDLDFTL